MNIYGIYLIDKISTGGNWRYIELLKGLAKKGHNVTVFVHKNLKADFQPCNTIPININFKKHRRISTQIAKALNLFLKTNKQKNADYIIAFGETDWKSAKVLKKHTGCNIIFAYRNDIISAKKVILKYETLNIKQKLFMFAEIIITRLRELSTRKHAKYLVFQTENDKNNFLKRNPKYNNKCKIIRNDILRPKFSSELKNKNTSTQCKTILFVGDYTLRKGFFFLLQALVKLKNKNLNFQCHIITKTECPKKIQDIIKTHNLENHIFELPPTNNVMPEMIQHNLVVVPSLFDSYPNVIMEAIHTGTPVIASNTSGMPYMLHHHDLLFQTADPDRIAEKISNCIENQNYYLHLKNLCNERRTFFEFDWIQEWENILN